MNHSLVETWYKLYFITFPIQRLWEVYCFVKGFLILKHICRFYNFKKFENLLTNQVKLWKYYPCTLYLIYSLSLYLVFQASLGQMTPFISIFFCLFYFPCPKHKLSTLHTTGTSPSPKLLQYTGEIHFLGSDTFPFSPRGYVLWLER